MLQELSYESRRMGLKMNIAKRKVMVVYITPIHVNNYADRTFRRLPILGTTLQPQEKETGQRDTTKNRGRLGGIAKYRDIFKSNLAICLKGHLCAASYALWCIYLDTWPNKHRTNLRPHRPKWKEVCSASHTRIERPTSGSWRRQKSYI